VQLAGALAGERMITRAVVCKCGQRSIVCFALCASPRFSCARCGAVYRLRRAPI
jgi:hypothetical protein